MRMVFANEVAKTLRRRCGNSLRIEVCDTIEFASDCECDGLAHSGHFLQGHVRDRYFAMSSFYSVGPPRIEPHSYSPYTTVTPKKVRDSETTMKITVLRSLSGEALAMESRTRSSKRAPQDGGCKEPRQPFAHPPPTTNPSPTSS